MPFEANRQQPHRAPRLGDRAAEDEGVDLVLAGNRDRLVCLEFGHDHAEADPHVEDRVHLLVGDLAELLDQPEDRLRLGQVIDDEPDLGVDAQEIQQAVAGHVRQRLHLQPLQHRQDRRDVDPGGYQQLLADAAFQRIDPRVDRQTSLLEENPARERQAIAVNTTAAQADDDVSGLDVFSDDDPIEWYRTNAGRDEVEAVVVLFSPDHLSDLRDLATGDGHAGLPSALVEPPAQFREHVRLQDLHRDVVDDGERLGADAENVVHIHRDAVDPDGIVPSHHLGDEQLGSDAVSRDRQTQPTPQIEDVREVADRQHRSTDVRTQSERSIDRAKQAFHAALLGSGIDARLGVDVGPLRLADRSRHEFFPLFGGLAMTRPTMIPVEAHRHKVTSVTFEMTGSQRRWAIGNVDRIDSTRWRNSVIGSRRAVPEAPPGRPGGSSLTGTPSHSSACYNRSRIRLPGEDVDGTIKSPSLAASARSAEIEVALSAAESLLLYAEALADPPAQAYLTLLRALQRADDRGLIRRSASALFRALATAVATGLPGPGDAWQRYLLRRVVSDENPFSRAAQRWRFEEIPAGLREAARYDLVAIGRLFALNGARLGATLVEVLGENPGWSDLVALGPDGIDDPLFARFASTDPVDWGNLLPDLAAHHRIHGVGPFAGHRAFRWCRRDGRGQIVPVHRPDPITFDDLIGYEEQRRIVRRNTENFLRGRPAHNLLLYGDRGTGKSSTVKALLNAYAGDGLRLVEVAKSGLADFPEIVATLDGRCERFIIFVDDLSFDENEAGYKELKAILEGSVETRPDNVLLYATSNRRHLIQERFGDRAAPDDEVHAQDTLQEKLSLADRFGITVIFMAPDQEQYLEIVFGLARRRGLEIDDARLRREALQWSSWNNGRSGRTARQFVDDLTAMLAGQ